MSEMGTIHLVCSFLAILTGAWVMWIPKGTRWHRTIGHAYGWFMVGLLVSAFLIYDLTGSFGPFHFAAIMSSVTLFGGMFTVLARRPRKKWVREHAIWMSWSYIGLMAAFAAESLTRFVMPAIAPLLQDSGQGWTVFWTSVAVASFGVMGIGWYILHTRLDAVVASAPEHMRRERTELRGIDSASAGSA